MKAEFTVCHSRCRLPSPGSEENSGVNRSADWLAGPFGSVGRAESAQGVVAGNAVDSVRKTLP